MISGIDLNETVDYKLSYDKNNPTIWNIGVIPSLVFIKLMREAKDDQEGAAYRVVQIALRGWDNFNIDYKTIEETVFGRKLNIVPLDVLEKIPVRAIMELANKAMELNQISEHERKN